MTLYESIKKFAKVTLVSTMFLAPSVCERCASSYSPNQQSESVVSAMDYQPGNLEKSLESEN